MGIQWYSKSIAINEFPTMSKNGLWIENLAELTELLLDDRLSGSNPQKMRFCPVWRRSGNYHDAEVVGTLNSLRAARRQET
jgi:hypothetical protein